MYTFKEFKTIISNVKNIEELYEIEKWYHENISDFELGIRYLVSFKFRAKHREFM